jgi:hypothetical protein
MNDGSKAMLLHFLHVDFSPVAGQCWLLDDESGAPYTPYRIAPSMQQMDAWQAELATAICAWAVIDHWSTDRRHAILKSVLYESASSLPSWIRFVRDRVLTKINEDGTGPKLQSASGRQS